MAELSDNDIIKLANAKEYRNLQLRKAISALNLAQKADREVGGFQPEGERERYLEASENTFKAINEQIGIWL